MSVAEANAASTSGASEARSERSRGSPLVRERSLTVTVQHRSRLWSPGGLLVAGNSALATAFMSDQTSTATLVILRM